MSSTNRDFRTQLSPKECVETFKRAVTKRPSGLNVVPLKFFTPPSKTVEDKAWDHRISVSFQAANVQMACKSTGCETLVSLSRVGPPLETSTLILCQHVFRVFNEADPTIEISCCEDELTCQQASDEIGPDAQVIQLPVPEPTDSGDSFLDYVLSIDFGVVPKTWAGLRSQILEFGHRSPDTEIDDDEVHSFLAVTITAASGRSQTVMISRIEETETADWLRIESAVGPYHPDVALAAINYVSLRENWAVGVARVTDHLYLRWTGTIGMNSLQNILTMIDNVAGMADRLEAMLSKGADEY